MCECGQESCDRLIAITIPEYERVRGDSRRFAVVRDHVMGDVERLPNGNTVIAFSTQGVVREVDSSGAVLQELSWPAGASFGYIEKRPTLYGPPPK